MNRKTDITIFTDGSSRGNPGPGGWADVIVGDGHIREFGGREGSTTNNRMELAAAAQALEALADAPFKALVQKGPRIAINTDSSYLINGITKWVKAWKRNGWQTQTKQDVLNRDLWEEIDTLASGLNASGSALSWHYVGGHVGVLGNERCDHIATDLADGNHPKLYSGLLGQYDLPDILDVSADALKSAAKSSSSSRSNARAYSYVSMIGGILETHRTWAECERRVKGARGARYKKALSADDEQKIMAEFKGTF